MHSTAAAQATGRLSGIVEDAGGKALSGARATLTLPESSVVHSSTITSHSGTFLFPALRPVFYDLTVEAPNFTTQTLKNVKVDPAAETSLPPIHLALGGARQVATAPEQSLQTASVDFASTANNDQTSRLPLPRRDPFYLVDMLPGVQHNGRAPSAVYGESASLGNITYDGVIMQESFTRANSLGSTTLSPRTDQIGEVTVVT
ncbi:MAG: carboxypeptidase-like regulatory domain-containing protein, partial [Bryobacteraceae bacterium]